MQDNETTIRGEDFSDETKGYRPTINVVIKEEPLAPEKKRPFDQVWGKIDERLTALSFNRYKSFIDRYMCEGKGPKIRYHGTESYAMLKDLTDTYMRLTCGLIDINSRPDQIKAALKKQVAPKSGLQDAGPAASLKASVRASRKIDRIDDASFEDIYRFISEERIPDADPPNASYLKVVLDKIKSTPVKEVSVSGIMEDEDVDETPCTPELIWSYWHEEGMLVQTMNAISMRFQNRVPTGLRNPLKNLEIAPLRPLNNLLWGFVQDELNRLSLQRRAHEYDHAYGIKLQGKAVPKFNSADSRSRFIASFHELLHRCTQLFKQMDDKMIEADAFPVLNALKEVHMLLSEGYHNQYRDLPWTARSEMLMMQWLLARPEMQEFLGGRAMVPYTEGWMDRVETMKKIQGWSETNILNFNLLAEKGERVLTSIRFTGWSSVNEPEYAREWARRYRADIQTYIHSYSIGLGPDLSKAVDTTSPSELLLRQEAGKGA